MNDFNKDQYEKYVDIYIQCNTDHTIGGSSSDERIIFFLKKLPKDINILEIGSGDGYDAEHMIKSGFHVTASDAVDSFVKLLREKNIPTISFDLKKDIITTDFQALYVNAVFVHFDSESIKNFFIRNDIKNKQPFFLFASFLKGSGSEISKRGRGFEREFYYYSKGILEELFSCYFKDVQVKDIDEKWLWVFVKN